MRSGSESGFTLLETIIALAMMTLAFAAILMVEDGSIQASGRTRQMNIVAMLARDAMVETERKIQGKSFDEVKKEDTGPFDAPYETYAWKAVIKEVELPNLNNLGQAGGSAGDSQQQPTSDTTEMITKLITNYLSKAIREVDVTVAWKKGEAEQSFTVTEYWVDLNHEFSLTD